MRKWVMFLVLVALIVQLGGCATRPQRGVHVEGKEGENVDVQW